MEKLVLYGKDTEKKLKELKERDYYYLLTDGGLKPQDMIIIIELKELLRKEREFRISWEEQIRRRRKRKMGLVEALWKPRTKKKPDMLEGLSNKEIAEMRDQKDRGIRKAWRELQFYLRQLTMGVLIFRSDKDFSFTGDEQRFFDNCREEYEFKN